MDPKFRNFPPGVARRLILVPFVPFVIACLVPVVADAKRFGLSDMIPLMSSLSWFVRVWPSAVYLLVVFSPLLAAPLYFWLWQKKILKRALAEDLCWGCLYCLKGCPDEDSLCPECGLPCSGSRKRWALFRVNFLFPYNGYALQQRATRKSERKAEKAAQKVEDAALKVESSP